MDTGLQDRVRFDDPIVGQLRGREVRFHGAAPSAGVAAAWFEVDMAENISGPHGWHQNGHGLPLRRQNSRPASTGLGWERRISLLIAKFERRDGCGPPLSCREERDATTPLVYRYRPSGGQVRRVETRDLRRGSERRSLRDTAQFAVRRAPGNFVRFRSNAHRIERTRRLPYRKPTWRALCLGKARVSLLFSC